jgi:hypothetical protein
VTLLSSSGFLGAPRSSSGVPRISFFPFSIFNFQFRLSRAAVALATCGLLAAATPASAEEPALIVVVVVDQFRADYLTRFDPWFGERGFRRFAREGAVFTNARQRHAVTSTGPGHATIGSGRLPSEHGIVANRWFDRDAPADPARWKAYFDETSTYRSPDAVRPSDVGRASARREDAPPRGSPQLAGSRDPLLLKARSLSDEIPRAKVISIALTDRAAILLGGRGADAAYWFDGPTARFVSSPWYAANPNVLAFNALVPGYMPASARWNPLHREAERATFDPPAAWPLKNNAYGGTFPHDIPTLRALQYTPFAHAMLLDLARHVIAEENPDLLFVSLSSTDYLGHLYGPDSMEVADSALRLDRALGAFMDTLERRYGERVLVALTSDHGVQSIPEVARLRDARADTGRIDLRVPSPEARIVRDLPPARIALERAVARRLDVPFSLETPLDQAFVQFFEEAMLYLNPQFRDERTRRALRDAVRELNGVAEAWTVSDPLPPLIRNSFDAERSGDVLIALRPGWIWMWGSNSTTHGQPVEDDLRVPLMFWGTGVKPGLYESDASPLDLARTLGALLGVEAGGTQSHHLPSFSYPSRNP